MKYFYDTEFLEGTQKKWFGNTKPTIDLISIGIVSEDNREYYAISKDFNLKEAWNRYDEVLNKLPAHNPNLRSDVLRARNAAGFKKVYWIRENVLRPIFEEFLNPIMDSKDNNLRKFNYKNFKTLINKYGKSNKQITEEVYDFCITYDTKKSVEENNPKLYGYYSAYDHVALCWLFGKMIDLPKGFPMYTIDLKQMLDEKENCLKNEDGAIELVSEIIPEHGCAMVGLFKSIKDFGTYPKQTNEHNALADAKWNKELYEFLQTLN